MFKKRLNSKKNYYSFDTAEEVVAYFSKRCYKTIGSAGPDRVKMAYKLQDGVLILHWDYVTKEVSIIPLTTDELKSAFDVFFSTTEE